MSRTLGENIKCYRKLMKVTQRQLSDYVGISVTTLSSYENSNSFPRKKPLYKIAKGLSVRISDLFLNVKPDEVK